MKTKKVLLPLAALLLVGIGTFVYFFGGPFRFVDEPLAEESLQHLRAGARSGAPWLSSPADTVFEYLYWWPQLDPTNRAKLDISVSYHSPDVAIVTVIDNGCRDDSTWRTCDRVTLLQKSGLWLPVRHQSAWQGRGRIGWTTQPTT
ncbi:MAG: hypothetical protein WCN98_15605 [Verrucomicrobiaceae bacterium]